MIDNERVAVITGATGGLGSVVARALAGAGVRLALFSTSTDKLARLVAGPCASTSVTSRPDRARWYAVHAPKQPAPTTTMRRMRNLQALNLEPRT